MVHAWRCALPFPLSRLCAYVMHSIRTLDIWTSPEPRCIDMGKAGVRNSCVLAAFIRFRRFGACG
eukprot:15474379-Alexandrium_andersonii.AAC.1